MKCNPFSLELTTRLQLSQMKAISALALLVALLTFGAFPCFDPAWRSSI